MSVPISYAGQTFNITFTGRGNRDVANYAWFAPGNSDQKVLLVGNSMDKPAVTSRLTLKTPEKGGIEIYKKGDGGGKLAGAVFKVTNASGQTVSTLTTNSNGYAKLDGLDPGTYYVQEITPPEGYLLDDTIHTAVVNAGTTITINATNTAVVGYITVKKTNSNAEMGDYPLSGAVFTIYNQSNTAVDTITTDETGEATSKALRLGTYKVRETKAPTGFVAGEDQTVTLSYAGETVAVVYASTTVPNAPQVGRIRLVKTNADTSFGTYSLEGAVFEVRDSKDELVDTLTTY